MNALQSFSFEGKDLRVIQRENAPWFIAKDVCNILGIRNNRDAIDPLDDDEKADVVLNDGRQNRRMRLISEGGLYTIILRSRQALTPGTVYHRFRKKVTSEILPALRRGEIRQAGEMTPTAPAPVDEVTRKLNLVTEARMTHGPAYAARLWKQLGLPDASRALPEPVDQDALACLRHLLRARHHQRKVGDLLNAAFRGDRQAAALLKEIKIEIKGDGFTVPNVCRGFSILFDGTRWERPFEHLRKLPSVKPHLPYGGRFAGEYSFVPSTYLNEA